MLAVNDLVKQYGNLVAVDGVSFAAAAGSVFGLLGPNGAGKSTVINCISGLLKPTGGRVTVDGANVVTESKRARQALGVVPQDLALYEDLPAVDNLRFWGRAYGLRGSQLEQRIGEVLGYIGLGDRALELPKTFSGGMKRRLNFGCGIVHRPRLLLLDEPTVGVDPQSRARLYDMVETERDSGACILYTTHYMEEAERLCDRVAIIDHGKLIAEGSVDELRGQLGARDVLQLSGHFAGTDGVAAVQAIEGIGNVEIVSADDADLVLGLERASLHLPAIFQALDTAGATISETSLRRANLETLFMLLTGKDLRE